jgi:predicted Zn-ribbon and HTH transcriptional regulator
VYNALDVEMKWHIISRLEYDVRTEESRPVSMPEVKRIPAHVLKAYIDGLIRQKETCPVTMEEFRLGNITVTGCGHAFEKGSLDTVSHCPLCRVNLVKEEFVCV